MVIDIKEKVDKEIRMIVIGSKWGRMDGIDSDEWEGMKDEKDEVERKGKLRRKKKRKVRIG